MTTKKQDCACESTRARSSVYGFLAAALRYPDREMLAILAEPERWSGWMETLDRTEPLLHKLLVAVRERLSSGDLDAWADALQDAHTQLFGHAVRGACPPYELEYERGDIPQKASELADIAGFYNAFGMELDAAAHERADHVSVQCEFMSVLAVKEVHALETDNAEARQIIHDAQRSFLADHAGRWFPALAVRLAEADADGFYGSLGVFLGEFIKTECNLFQARCGPQYLELRPIDPKQDATIECGVEPSCPGASPESPDGGDSLVQIGIDRE